MLLYDAANYHMMYVYNLQLCIVLPRYVWWEVHSYKVRILLPVLLQF